MGAMEGASSSRPSRGGSRRRPGCAVGEAFGGVEDVLGEGGEQRGDGAEAGVFAQQVDGAVGLEEPGDVERLAGWRGSRRR